MWQKWIIINAPSIWVDACLQNVSEGTSVACSHFSILKFRAQKNQFVD